MGNSCCPAINCCSAVDKENSKRDAAAANEDYSEVKNPPMSTPFDQRAGRKPTPSYLPDAKNGQFNIVFILI